MKYILSIAGSDPMGASGIDTDKRAGEAQDAHVATIITTISAQNNEECLSLQSLSREQILDQYRSISKATPPDAIKIGMLASVEAVEAVVEILETQSPFVFDPVIATNGVKASMRPHLKSEAHTMVDIITPNLHEAGQLVSQKIEDADEIREAAQKLKRVRGGAHKGGHRTDEEDSTDYFSKGNLSMWLTGPRLEGHSAGRLLPFASNLGLGKGYRSRSCRRRTNTSHEALESSTPWAKRGLRETKGLGTFQEYIVSQA